jgi:hypothetical protein
MLMARPKFRGNRLSFQEIPGPLGSAILRNQWLTEQFSGISGSPAVLLAIPGGVLKS